MNQQSKPGVLITGAGGYLGGQVVSELAGSIEDFSTLAAMDIRLPLKADRLPGVQYLEGDIRDADLGELFKSHGVDTVVHLAAIVTPGKGQDRAFLHSVEVEGTRNVLEACAQAGVKRFIYTSSGAAYGYYPDNPEWIDETGAIRGNPEFAYSDHKRQVEDMLSGWRSDHPELEQLIFRPGTILGAGANNQITALFDKKVVLGIAGSDSPFVFIWDRDVVGAIVQGITGGGEGIYNMAGDGALPMPEIAKILGKPYLPLPAWLVCTVLWVLHKFGLSQYGPEQVRFLRYRPVLSNRRLKEEFGYTPAKTSREVFDFFLDNRPEPDKDGFRDKVVVVTGGGSGLGAAFCRRFAQAGAKTAAVDVNQEAAANLAAQLEGEGAQALGMGCDVTDPGACQRAVDAVLDQWGRIDLLINNAGITQRSAFADTKPEVYRRVMDVNLFGSVHAAQAALPALKESQGLIMVISSIAGFAPVLGRTGYAASKHALHGLFGSLRGELAPDGVGVSIVCPWFADTGISTSALGGDGEVTSHPQSTVGRIITADEVAEQVFLAARKRKRLTVLSPLGKLTRLMTRAAPGLYEKIMAWKLKPELER